MDKKVFEQEKAKLKDTVNLVKDALEDLKERMEGVGKDNLDKLTELRENPETDGLDFFMFLEQIHQENFVS